MLLLLLDKEENLYQGTSHGQDDFLDDILDVKLKISRHTIALVASWGQSCGMAYFLGMKTIRSHHF